MNIPPSIKKTIYNLHLYLGLAAGLIIFLVCLTGALYTFRTQIENAINYKKVYIETRDQAFISLDSISSRLHQQGLHINSITNYNAKNRSIEVHYSSIEGANAGMYFIDPIREIY
ncbi:PepSY domain-containing protein [Saccharicrinis fermentans]|uniref:Putative iron-regulated membrane protein n=1 Tax=Saccharicrinis fermentans DSM 9555 = JCM 21142 TaxID=869213 RepID=W7YIS5_9BACT|nr:PepSY domain-containing protein [Saccharicrinis fermentans]GAF02434.1 putative iron-regulated membrane protein [Saccharicrinis fermentans DSM 9555 = JCM 21142]